MPLRQFVIAALVLAVPAARGTAQSPSDREEVRRAAMDYIEGFYEGDTAKMVRSIRPDVFKYGFYVPRDSAKYVGETMPWPEFLDYARRFKARNRTTPASAPRDVVVFEVQDQTASAKVTAWWGTDYLLLGKFDGRWMITHVLWQSPPRKSS